MCGIVGILNLDGAPVRQDYLYSMSELIAYRGPDGSGVMLDREFGCAHRRLSIIDLSPAGQQPMEHARAGLSIVFNGEIYNYLELADELRGMGHVFRTHTDTEVILHAYEQWGPDCVHRFIGMWAFAIWDQRTRSLFCSRDRFGIKPFYYYAGAKTLVFASEIKALFAHPDVPREMNAQAIHRYLKYHVKDDSEATCFKDIRQLRPGHNLVASTRGVVVNQYWKLQFEPSLSDGDNVDDCAERFRDLLTDSVRLQLRSDVPVGTCLSGGLDSNCITSIAAAMHPGVLDTFSVVFPGTAFDESRYVDLLNGSLENTRPHVERPNGDDVIDVLEKTVWHHDEPCWGPAVYSWWYVMKCVSAGGVKVVLNGQGADELLAGYPIHYPTYLRQLLRQRRLVEFLRELTPWRLQQGMSLAHAVKWLLAPLWPASLRQLRRRGDAVQSFEDSFLDPDFRRSYTESQRAERKSFSQLSTHLQHDLAHARLPELLHAEDRFSMAFSLESRVPFLDHRLVEFAARLPDSLKLKRGMTKVVMRHAMLGRLPSATLERKDKMGYPTPGEEWLKTIGRDYVQDTLHSQSIRDHGVFDVDLLRRRYQKNCDGASKMKELWRWISTEVWMKTFLDPPKISAVHRSVVGSGNHAIETPAGPVLSTDM